MLEYDRKDISEGSDINKTNASKECEICLYWYFLDKGFKYQPCVCNDYHDLMQKATNFNDVAIVSTEGSNYRIHFWYMSKDDAIDILKISDFKKRIIINFFHYI